MAPEEEERDFGKKRGIFVSKCSKKEPLANACVKWLLMLYYEGSSLNGRDARSGLKPAQTVKLQLHESKWLRMPVRD